MFTAWGRIVYRFRWLVLIASALSLVAAVFLAGYGGRLGTGESSVQTESGRANDLVEKELPERLPSFTLIFSSDGLQATDPAFRSEVERALGPLRDEPRVARVRTAYDDSASSSRMISRDGKRTFAVVELKNAGRAELQDNYGALRQEVHSDSLGVLATGGLPLNKDFRDTTESDLQRAELVSLPLALLMLLFVFGSVVAAGLPIGVGILAVVAGFTGTLLLARTMDVSIYATNVVSMIGLGVAIDYSLFIVSRFREEVNRRPVVDALSRAMATTGRAVVFSGFTVAIGLLGFLFFSIGDLSSMGIAGTIVVALAVFYGLTFLPALLAILGGRVNALRLPFVHPERTSVGRGLWHRLANAVMSHPWRVLLPVVALLVLLGSPFLGLRLGLSGPTTLPPTSEARQGQELLEDQFPGGDTNPIVVVLDYPDGSPLTADHAGEVYDVGRWLEGLPGVNKVESAANLDPDLSREQYQQLLSGPDASLAPEVREAVRQSTGGHVAALTAYTPLGFNTDEAHDLVRTIRDSHPAVSGTVLVGGQAASDLDLTNSVASDAPLAIAFIVVATYAVLFLLLRSVLLPLKAVLTNFLSISASFGALAWIFQEGHLSGLLNFTPGPIDTTTPIIMFCILFGLSMDYEVLLLSRIKEEYGRTKNNRASVALGIERTGRLITGAAVIMATVFFSFGLAEAVVIKAIGLGMGLAVMIDATIVRALLVPAAMRLMGRWNWWSPRFLEAVMPRFDVESETSPSPRTLVLTGLSLEYLARKIENANGGSPNLVRVAASLVPVSQNEAADERARLAAREVLRPLALRTMLTGVRGNEATLNEPPSIAQGYRKDSTESTRRTRR